MIRMRLSRAWHSSYLLLDQRPAALPAKQAILCHRAAVQSSSIDFHDSSANELTPPVADTNIPVATTTFVAAVDGAAAHKWLAHIPTARWQHVSQLGFVSPAPQEP